MTSPEEEEEEGEATTRPIEPVFSAARKPRKGGKNNV
jgi:hypothetical protein